MPLKLDILTPRRVVVSTDVDEVQVPAKGGYIGVLPQHAPLISELRAGTIEYKAGGKTELIAASEGYVEVLPDRVSVLVDTAERKADIDVARAEAALRQAEEMVRTARGDHDLNLAICALERALARLQTARK